MSITSPRRPIQRDTAPVSSRAWAWRAAALSVMAVVLAACSSATGTPSASPTGLSSTVSASDPAGTASGPATLVTTNEPWIVFQRYDATSGALRLILIRPDGTGEHQLLPDSAGLKQTHPDWSPDGRRIVFLQGDKQIWTVEADGSHLSQVAVPCDTTCQNLDSPVWSPDGRAIAYVRLDQPSGKDPYMRVQKVNVADGSVSTLYTPPHTDGTWWVRWSPDGHSLVVDVSTYPSLTDSTVTGSAIGVVDLTTRNPKARILTPFSMFATYPDWSSHGDRIVFTTYDLGVRDDKHFADPSQPSNLYTVKPDGTGLTQVTHNAKGPDLIRDGTASGPLSSQPTWTPDGKQVMFVQVEGVTWPGWTLALISPDGTGLAPAVSTGYTLGTHPRLRPTRA